MADAVLVDIGIKGDACGFFEAAGQIGIAVTDFVGQLGKIAIGGEAFFHKGENLVQKVIGSLDSLAVGTILFKSRTQAV